MKIVLAVLLSIGIIIIASALGMFFFWIGWNNFVSPILGLPNVNLWQSFFALLLLGIIGSAFKTSVKVDNN